MKFELSEDQELLRSTTADMLAAESPIAISRQISEADGEGFSREQWKKLADLGYLGLLLPADVGGQDLGPLELALVCAEMGKVCLPGPYVDVTAAASVLQAAGGCEARLAAIAAGGEIVVSAEIDRVWPTDAPTIAVDEGRLTGTKYFVPFGASADAMVVSTPDGLYLVDGPFSCQPMATLDEAARFVQVDFDHPARRIGDNELSLGVRELEAVAAAAQALGLCERTTAMTVEYAGQRETFGKPIGTYQVLQHRMADMLLRTESARATVLRAAWCLASAAEDAVLAAAAAKQYAVESANQIARDAVQIHGGNGFTWEYDLHFFLKRAVTLSQCYGSDEEVLERALGAYLEATA